MKTIAEMTAIYDEAKAKLKERKITDAEANADMLKFLRERGDIVNGRFEPVYTHEQAEAAKTYFYDKYMTEIMESLSAVFNGLFEDD